MQLSRTIKIFLLLVLSLDALSQSDSIYHYNLSIDDSARKLIEQKPSVVTFKFYLNGKIKKNFKLSLMKNGVILQKITPSNFSLNHAVFGEGDSLSFVGSVGKFSIQSRRLNPKRFEHGGEIIFGLITDFDKEKRKYLADSSEYLISHQKDYLYFVVHSVLNNSGNTNSRKLLYTFSISNIANKIEFTWKFFEK
jgi:hypothetical protein